jgi:kynurenine formamidase
VNARIALAGGEVGVDLARPVSLALTLDFDGPQPRHFGAPRATARPFEAPGFSGAVASGASCNCEVITLIPHCQGTHTECAGHLTHAKLDAYRVVPAGLVPAVLLSVTPVAAAVSGESTVPAPAAGDLLISAAAIEAAWPAGAPFAAQALVIRTLPNTVDKATRDYTLGSPPYLSRQAAQLMVTRGIQHLIVDVPSLDRAYDDGRLTAHRIFFGLPPESAQLDAAARPDATVTEFAFIPDALADGAYLLELQVPALAGDAVPSRPLLYPLLPAEHHE